MLKKIGAVGGALLVGTGSALAAVPAAVTDALTEAATDVGTMGGLLIAVSVVAVGFMIGIKYVKRARGAS